MKSTKTFLSIFIMFFMVSLSVSAQSKWNVDEPHAKVTFSTVHNTISDVEGLFNKFDASITASQADFSDAVFELSIDASSIDTEVKMRDDHLRSEDFFHVEKFPTITFKSTSIEKADKKDRYKLKGELTIHGVTKTVTMDMWYRGTIENPENKSLIAGFQVSGKLNRLDFNVGPNFPESLISNEVIIKADGEFIKK